MDVFKSIGGEPDIAPALGRLQNALDTQKKADVVVAKVVAKPPPPPPPSAFMSTQEANAGSRGSVCPRCVVLGRS